MIHIDFDEVRLTRGACSHVDCSWLTCNHDDTDTIVGSMIDADTSDFTLAIDTTKYSYEES